jgi:predicted GH43/DUF377 family glycosyl hydrolase
MRTLTRPPAGSLPEAGFAERLPENPLILPRHVPPSLPSLEVVAVFNAATARMDGETVLLLRVAERPRKQVVFPKRRLPGNFQCEIDHSM